MCSEINDSSGLIKLKQLTAGLDRKNQSIATTVGMLACSDINNTELMPEMCHLLKLHFNLKSSGFFWCDEKGNMTDAWCLSPAFLRNNSMASYLGYQTSKIGGWPTFKQNVLLGATAGYLLPFQNERFYASEPYAKNFQPIGVRHVMDVVLHDGMRPFGAFLMMRDTEQGKFTQEERKLLLKLIPIFNNAFLRSEHANTRYAKKETAGFALLCRDRKYKSMSDEARRIVWMLTRTTPGSFVNSNDENIERHLEQLAEKCFAQSTTHGSHYYNVATRWGKFHLAFEQQQDTNDIVVALCRNVPLLSQLVFALLDYDFPPVRLIVAWLLAQNKTRNQISSALNISIETVTDHIKLIYKATGTNSSHGLLLHLES
ncbi:MAG: helix-turn-helix transcriptional regulator [Gallionella sp.]